VVKAPEDLGRTFPLIYREEFGGDWMGTVVQVGPLSSSGEVEDERGGFLGFSCGLVATACDD
jgi:hypothetical protein